MVRRCGGVDCNGSRSVRPDNRSARSFVHIYTYNGVCTQFTREYQAFENATVYTMLLICKIF